MSKLPLQNVLIQAPYQATFGLLSPPGNKQIQLYETSLCNKSGGAIDVGILRGMVRSEFNLYKIIDADTPKATKLAVAAQTIITTTNNDGYMVQSSKKFNLVQFIVTQAETGSPTYTYEYWNGASWSTLTTLNVPSVYTGTVNVVFITPSDWAIGDGTLGGSSSLYSIKVIATTAPSRAVIVSEVYCAQFIDVLLNVANNGTFNIKFNEGEPLILDAGEDVIPYFKTLNVANYFRALFKVV